VARSNATAPREGTRVHASVRPAARKRDRHRDNSVNTPARCGGCRRPRSRRSRAPSGVACG
jgi:hypothetical protein